MGHGQAPQRADRVAEERVRAVERIDVAVAVDRRAPAAGLHCPAGTQGQLVEFQFAGIARDAAFEHQPAEVAVGADVVEPVVVDADVRHVRGHVPTGVLAAQGQHPRVARGVELQNRRAELEALGPLGPAAGGVAALDRKHGGPWSGVPVSSSERIFSAESCHIRSRAAVRSAGLICSSIRMKRLSFLVPVFSSSSMIIPIMALAILPLLTPGFCTTMSAIAIQPREGGNPWYNDEIS